MAILTTNTSSPCKSDIEVLVVSSNPKLVGRRIHVAKLLWQNGIKANYTYDETKSVAQIEHNCKSKGVPIVVVIRDNAPNNVKVVNIVKRREESTVRLIELPSVVLEILKQATGSQYKPDSKQIIYNPFGLECMVIGRTKRHAKEKRKLIASTHRSLQPVANKLNQQQNIKVAILDYDLENLYEIREAYDPETFCMRNIVNINKVDLELLLDFLKLSSVNPIALLYSTKADAAIIIETQ